LTICKDAFDDFLVFCAALEEREDHHGGFSENAMTSVAKAISK